MGGVSENMVVITSLVIVISSLVLFFVFPLVVLLHCWLSKGTASQSRRWIWTAVIVLLWPLGSLVYGLFGSRSRLLQVLTLILAAGSLGVSLVPSRIEIDAREHADVTAQYAEVGESKRYELDRAWGELARAGWGNYLQTVAWSADGEQVLVGRRRTLRLHDVESGRVIKVLESLPENDFIAGWLTGKWLGRGDPIALSPDGRYALAEEGDVSIKSWLGLWEWGRQLIQGHRRVERWDLETGKSGYLTGHDLNVKAIAFLPGGSQALTASFDKTVRLWDVPRGKRLATFEGHPAYVFSLAVSPDGRRALSGGNQPLKRDPSANTLWLWDLEAQSAIRALDGHTKRVVAVAFSSDGLTGVSASYDRTMRVWDLASGRELRRIWVAGIVKNVTFSRDARYAAVGFDDVKIWDVERGAVVDSIPIGQTGDRAKVLAFAPDSRGLLVGTDKGALLFYRWTREDLS